MFLVVDGSVNRTQKHNVVVMIHIYNSIYKRMQILERYVLDSIFQKLLVH